MGYGTHKTIHHNMPFILVSVMLFGSFILTPWHLYLENNFWITFDELGSVHTPLQALHLIPTESRVQTPPMTMGGKFLHVLATCSISNSIHGNGTLGMRVHSWQPFDFFTKLLHTRYNPSIHFVFLGSNNPSRAPPHIS